MAQAPHPQTCRMSSYVETNLPHHTPNKIDLIPPESCISFPLPRAAEILHLKPPAIMSRDDDTFGGSWGDGQFDPSAGPPPGENEKEWILRNADRLGINYDSLPHPPFWSPLFGQGQDWYKTNVASKVMGFSVLLRRELSQQEKEIVSYHAAKECTTRALEPPVAVALAYALERRGRANFKFPFWTPKPTTINPDFFPSQRFALVRNNMAWAAWHATRFSSYAFFCHLFLSGVFTSYAMSVWVTSMKLDPRLDSLRKTMEELGKQGRLGRRLGEQGTGAETWQSQSQDEDPSIRDSSFPYSSQPSEDDSTGSGARSEEYGRSQANSGRFEGTGQNRGYPRPGQGYSSSPQDTRQQSQEPPVDDNADLFDDASPIAPSARGRGGSSSGTGGSAWDRLRSQATSGADAGSQAGARSSARSWPETQRNPSQSARSSEGYTYSAAEEDKSYAKAQAQKEFDAMLEKERRGESETRGRRW